MIRREIASRERSLRCPGGYLVLRGGLCGASGNRCIEECAFAYRDPSWMDAPAKEVGDA